MDGEDFKQRVYRVMEDDGLSRIEKLVMVAHFLYEGNPRRIEEVLGFSPQYLQLVDRRLMHTDWLASPEG